MRRQTKERANETGAVAAIPVSGLRPAMSPSGLTHLVDRTPSAMRILTGDEIGVMNAAEVRNRIAACDRIGTLHHMVRAFAPKGSTKMLSRRSLLGGLLATFVFSPFAAAIAPSRAAAQSFSRPNRAPPPLRVEPRPGPRPGYVWGPGYWAWSPRRRNYTWTRGRWHRNRPGFRYQSPRWVMRSGNWVYAPGGWVR
jgi:hypothetical protein